MSNQQGLKDVERSARFLNVLAICLAVPGLAFGVMGFLFDEPGTGWASIGGAVAVLVVLPMLARNQVATKRAQVAAVQAEQRRLTELKNSMTVAEWEAYKLQLENNILLNQIASRGRGPVGPTMSMGFIAGLPENGDQS